MKNYYEELEVSRQASPEVISRAYKVLAKKYHPDSTSENKELAEERFKRISEAYEVLSNEEKRKDYDANLEITDPLISKEDYYKILEDNKTLSNEISSLKNKINNLSNNTANSFQNNNTNLYTNYNSNVNTNYTRTPNNNQTNHTKTYYTNKRTNSYSFMDLIKFRVHNFFRSFFAFILTLIFIFIIVSVLLYIPFTKDFILNDLNFNIFFDLFK